MTKELVATIYAYFIKDGTAITGGGTVSRTAISTTDGDWTSLGTVPKEGLTISPNNVTQISVDRPNAAGGWSKYDVIDVQTDWTIKAAVQDLNELTQALMFGSATKPIVTATAFSPFQHNTLRGYLKFQFVDHNGSVLHTVDAYGKIKVGEVKVGVTELTKPGFEHLVLSSTKNAGLITWA